MPAYEHQSCLNRRSTGRQHSNVSVIYCKTTHGSEQLWLRSFLLKNNASSGIREPLSTKPYFSIHLDKNTVRPGQTVEVKIQADEFYFEGFILQARNASDNTTNKRFGTFKPHNEDSKLICNNAGITHSKHFKWNNITFSWIAPQETTDKIRFIATVVRGYSTFFMNVQSEVVMISSASLENLSMILLIAAVLVKWM
ncbi:hypothetical protein Btru_076758 [Bulinus truncatus]|nr:hypothetical protein Btru_076758 [Bulinus truncatus]